jgi:hypothetical protein
VALILAHLEATAADRISAEPGVTLGGDIRDSTITFGFTRERLQTLIQSSTQELKTTYQVQVDEVTQQF